MQDSVQLSTGEEELYGTHGSTFIVMALLHFAMSATVDYEQHHLASVPCQMLNIVLIILINFIIIVILVRRASVIRR